MRNSDRYLVLSGEVAHAIRQGGPVVALESTIISHGMPYPRNLETARELEQTVRAAGAVPATIAIIDGAFRIGLSDAQIELLATAAGVTKASRRDLGMALAGRSPAATTVSATMIGAHLAGIPVFATGGIGGVHRGGQHTLDISADLQELARTPVAVVCAGVKSMLDIGRTLEYLETMGVPVFGYRTAEFPAFYTRSSGLPAPLVAQSPQELAAALTAQWESGLTSGALVANPIPEAAELEYGYIEEIIQRALGEADQRGISGREVTPYLLSRIVELSHGRSLDANIALAKNNARLAAELAAALAAV